MQNELIEISLVTIEPNQVRYVIQKEQQMRKQHKIKPDFYCYVLTEEHLKKFLNQVLQERKPLSRCQIIIKTRIIPWAVIDVRMINGKYEFLLLTLEIKQHRQSLKHLFDLIQDNFPPEYIAAMYCMSLNSKSPRPVDFAILAVECARRLSLLPVEPCEALKNLKATDVQYEQFLLETYGEEYIFGEDDVSWAQMREQLNYIPAENFPAVLSDLTRDFNEAEIFSIQDCMRNWEGKVESRNAAGLSSFGIYASLPDSDEVVQQDCWPCVLL